jgi:hypothetical protein
VGRGPVPATANERTNFVTNPSFEGTGFWSASSSGTVTSSSFTINSTDFALYGTKSGKLIEGNGSSGHLFLHSSAIPVTPLITYTFSISVYIPSFTSGVLAPAINDNSFNRLNTGTSLSAGNSNFVRISSTFKIPGAGTPDGTNTIVLLIDASGVPLYTAYVDGGMLETSVTPGTYFDGTVTGATWSGTANASTSLLPIGGRLPA